MAISTFADYKDKLSGPYQRIVCLEQGSATIAGRLCSLYSSLPNLTGTFAAPTTAAVPAKGIAGALDQLNSSGTQRLVRIVAQCTTPGTFILVDRLSHQGALSGTDITAQTTNLSTAALTRYTSGVGVFAGLEIYGTLGTTGTTVTISYTNAGGSSGQTSQPVLIGATGYRELNRVLIPSLASGHTGVEAVASVTVLATTGTAGNFGVTLFKPLTMIHIPVANRQFTFDMVLGLGLASPIILSDACLHWMAVSTSTSSGALHAELFIVEE